MDLEPTFNETQTFPKENPMNTKVDVNNLENEVNKLAAQQGHTSAAARAAGHWNRYGKWVALGGGLIAAVAGGYMVGSKRTASRIEKETAERDAMAAMDANTAISTAQTTSRSAVA